MTIRRFGEHTQRDHVRQVREFTAFAIANPSLTHLPSNDPDAGTRRQTRNVFWNDLRSLRISVEMTGDSTMDSLGHKRRDVLFGLLVTGAGLGALPLSARTISGTIPWTAGWAATPYRFDGARFFTAAERRCIEAMVERLIPSDERGPGARDANVIGFIDNQLAGFYGRGERWYMAGPFGEGTTEQGYQYREPPAGLYRAGIAALEQVCATELGGRGFADLSTGEQDAVLARLEKGDLPFGDVPARSFFALVMENAIEGFFCDPLYGGNRDMVGWRLVGFPGARYDYRDFLNHNGAPIALEPVGLMGGPGWSAR